MIKLKDILREIEELQNGHISKEEEFHALEIIKSKMIPKYMEFIKDSLRIAVNPKTAEDKIRKTLKKTKHIQNDDYYKSDRIEYSTPAFGCKFIMYKHYFHSAKTEGPKYGIIIGFFDKQNARYDTPMDDLV